ncbi:MAG: pyridoxamine 5'-phosphate oxidase family protein [Clostridiales bacterium]|jgi:hypothetical protein|nr:pyridoxamine 5'-phosphate oxidase family protein [Clostridiales bacterium]
MSRYEDGIKIIEDTCGNGKDNVIALATLEMTDGKMQPVVRDVNAFYEDGVFYITSTATSGKARQIAANNNVAFAVHFEGISGKGIGDNLGWVLDPKNADLRLKLRKAFSDWYDAANNEQNEDCIVLAVRISQVSLFRDHGAVRYNLDFVNKTEAE